MQGRTITGVNLDDKQQAIPAIEKYENLTGAAVWTQFLSAYLHTLSS